MVRSTICRGIPSLAVLALSGLGDAPFHAGAHPVRTLPYQSSRKLDSCY